MALQYMSILSSDMLLSDIEAHTEWFGQVIRNAFFAEESGEKVVDIPSALVNWCVEEADNMGIEGNTVQQLQRLHQELEDGAKLLIQETQSGQPVTLDSYNAIEYRLIAYINQLRRLEEDVSGVSTALDPVTGLRSVSGMKNDISRELDRRERKGNPFCVCEIEIDNVVALIEGYDRQMLENIYSAVADLLMKSIRSFDDAYHLGKGDYFLVLKHIDILDACSVMDRMRDEVSKVNIDVIGSFDPLNVTASFGVAEPVPGDDINDILGYAKKALKQAQCAGGNQVIQWQEQSALQEYATDISGFD